MAAVPLALVNTLASHTPMQARSALATHSGVVCRRSASGPVPRRKASTHLKPPLQLGAHLQRVQDLPSPCSPLPAETAKTVTACVGSHIAAQASAVSGRAAWCCKSSCPAQPSGQQARHKLRTADTSHSSAYRHTPGTGSGSKHVRPHSAHEARQGLHLYFLEGGLLTAARQQPCQRVQHRSQAPYSSQPAPGELCWRRRHLSKCTGSQPAELCVSGWGK